MTENPYYQYFIGLPGYQEEPPIDASTLVLFRKRLKMDVIMEANEYMPEAFTRSKNAEAFLKHSLYFTNKNSKANRDSKKAAKLRPHRRPL